MKITNNQGTRHRKQPNYNNQIGHRFLIVSWLLSFGYWLLISSPALAALPQPAWQAYGKIINNTAGNTIQQKPKLITDGQDNSIIVWEDSRSGNYDLYAQKVSPSGQKLWPKDGVAVCQNSGNQNSAQITGDGHGGVIIVWQDYRNKNADVFIQRINSQGIALWGQAGTPVCNLAGGQFAPQLISDNNGGAIVTWHDYRSGVGEDIYAQRVDNNGQLVWDKQGVTVAAAKGTQWYPKISPDDADGAIIVWTDGRKGPADNDIYAQRLDSKGKTLWQKDGISICAAKQNQEYPTIIPSNKGAIVAWTDSRLNNADIFAQKIDLQGKGLWQKNGVAVCTVNYNQEHPQLSADGNGGAIVVWQDQRGATTALYGQRLSNSGQLQWQTTGRQISRFGDQHKDIVIVKLTGEDQVIIWEETRKGQTSLLAQKINGSGTPLWQNGGKTLTKPSYNQGAVTATIDQSGRIIAVWQDKRFGQFDIYGQKISADGELLWHKKGQVICSAVGAVAQQNIQTITTKKQDIILAFEDGRAGFLNVYLQKNSSRGNLLWGQQGIAAAKAFANQINPSLISDNKEGVIVVWEDYRNKKFPSIRAQHFNAQGKKLWASSLALASFKSAQTKPITVSDGAGGAFVIWQENRDVLSLQDIYGQHLSASGKLLWGKKGKIIVSANGDQTDLTMIPDGQGGAIIAWTDYRNGNRNPDIYAQRINSKGKALWPDKSGIKICSAPDIQRNPKLTGDGTGGAVIAWTDRGGGSYDIYAQRINNKGKALWLKDGIPINQLSRTQQNPKFGTDQVVVWEDYRFGNWDIFAASVNNSGKLLWGENGSNVAVIPQTQYAPQIAKWKSNQVIVVWEDYRSGQQYEIFVQKLDEQGQPLWTENGVRVKTKNGARFPALITMPDENVFYVFWEDFTNGDRAIYGQKFISR